ncbi:MAG: ABC transporter permease subunit [Planctomycetes bacterium]|nr:ABC transporter permease subunit [Planctomycetota bacterium]
MKNVWTLARRELSGYFATPVAYVFLFFYLVFMGVMPFALGGFYEREQADLVPFFQFHPWLYLFLIPAVSMRLWAEERKSGTVELLMTLPVTLWQMVLGKFLAAWFFTGLALVLTFPMVITVNFLGKPDNGVILASYIGSFLLAGGYLAVGSLFSASTKNQVIAFVLTFVVGLLFVLAGHPFVLDWVTGTVPAAVTDAVRSFSFLTQMNTISGGVIDVRALTYFGSLIVACLIGSGIVLDMKKAA